MASRRATSYWRRMLLIMRSSSSSSSSSLSFMGGGGGNGRKFVTSTSPKMKPVAATRYSDHYSQQQQQKQPPKPRGVKGEFVPVYVSAGLILLAGLIGLHTMNQQLRYNPAVLLKKKRRETFPEVEDPDHVVEESDNLINKSFFRKVAHLQQVYNDDAAAKDDNHHTINPLPAGSASGDVYTRARNTETLKSVGVDPSGH